MMDETCQNCYGVGYIITCPDDLCANSDRCMHGDGESICPECHGGGYFPPDLEWDEVAEREVGP